jgi:peptidoglycan/LPS O-acetylase OafA/YrhL
MTAILWIGFGLLAVFIMPFVIIMYFPPKNYDPRLIRLRASLCTSFAGGFLSAQALFQMLANLSNGFN